MTRTIQQLFDLTGKTALVTGGSRGLGLQMAHALGEAGARVMLCSRKAADLELAVAELQAAGIDARWIAADCAVEEDIRRLADETLERMGRIDILVNNAASIVYKREKTRNQFTPYCFYKDTLEELKVLTTAQNS